MAHYKPAECSQTLVLPDAERPGRVKLYLGEINGKPCWVSTLKRNLIKESQHYFRMKLENQARLETTSARLRAKLEARKIERAAASVATQ